MDFTVIEGKIVENLKKVSDLKSVYDHEPKSLTTLPAATLFFDGFDQDDIATRQKRVNWRWTVRVYVRVQDAEQAQSQMKKLVKSIRETMAMDPTLGGTCLFQMFERAEIFVSSDQTNVHMVAEMPLIVATNESY